MYNSYIFNIICSFTQKKKKKEKRKKKESKSLPDLEHNNK